MFYHNSLPEPPINPPETEKTSKRITVYVRFAGVDTIEMDVPLDLDLTNADSEQILLPVIDRPVFHHYSDGLETSVASYALEEIMAEKIRSIFQRTRSRDLYDIGQLAGRVDRDIVRSIVHRKCEYKGVTVDPALLREKRDQFAALWQVSLGHQIHDIPDFDSAFENVMGEIEGYSTT